MVNGTTAAAGRLFYANGTAVFVVGPTWNLVEEFYAAVSVIAFLTNGAVLLLFCVNASLRRPFNIYIINLIGTNFLYSFIHSPAEIINNLYSGWWLSAEYCSVYIYANWVLEAAIRNCHVLITLNRVWAGTFFSAVSLQTS